MAERVVSQGLQMIADRASGVSGAGAALLSIGVDNSTTAFVAGDTTLGAGATSVAARNFDSTPTRSSQTVTHVSTFPAASGNFLIRRISLHNLTDSSVTNATASLIAGVDAQSLTKTSDFTLEITVKITYTAI